MDYGSNYNQVCIDEFGSSWELADWTDIESYYSNGGNLDDLAMGTELDTKINAWVTKNGASSYSSTRNYFASYHRHSKPSNYLAHNNIALYMTKKVNP